MTRAAFAFLPVLLVTASALGAQQPADTTVAPAATRPSLSDSILGAGAAGAWLRAERGFSVGTLTAARDDISDAPSLPRALQGRLPGVSVSQGEGYLGSSSRVWLRGPSSVYVNEPLLIVDGARTHAASAIRPFSLGPLPSRLEDIDPEAIERIEVLRGAAASAVYGPGASKGVILVTTRRGAHGPTRWSAFAETGPLMEVTDYPANHGTLGTSTADAQPTDNCPLRAQADGSCVALSRRSWNPLENASPFRTGWTNGAGMSASGGAGQLTWRAGVNHDRATGVYRRDEGSATAASANVSVAATPTVDVRFSGAYRTEDLRHPTADYIALGLRGASVDDPIRRGYGTPLSGGANEAGRRDEHDHRVTAAIDATWRPRDWLRASLLVGYDRVRDERQFQLRQPGFTVPGIPSSGDSVTMRDRTRDTPEARTASVEAEATWRHAGTVGRSALGFQYLRDDDRGESSISQIPDTPGDPAFQSETFASVRRISKGIYARQHVAWQRLYVTGTLRVDQPNEDYFGTMLSPSVDVSWVPIRATDRTSPLVDELRLRAAYGHGGGHLIPTLQQNPSAPGVRPSDESAERSTEFEVGADLSLFDNVVLASVTAYRAINDRALARQSVPTSGGFEGGYLSNGAEFRMGGIEATVDARLLGRSGFTWDAGIGIASHRTRTEDAGAPASVVGVGEQRIQPGESIGEYHPRRYTWADQNGDQLIASSEVTLSDENSPSGGSPFPDYEASLHTSIGFGRAIRIAALVDRRAGQKLFNGPASVRCSFVPNCREQHDPGTPLAEQAAAVAAAAGAGSGYLEDASFTKLREVRLSIELPRQWAGSASSARLSFTGRNLHTWTDYRGLDPEIISRDLDHITASDSFHQSPLRTFTARLDLAW